MSLELFLAFRFLSNLKEEKNISSMVKVCFLSILISVFSLTLVCAVMNGFSKATCQKLQGIHSDITINAMGKELNFDKLKTVIFKDFRDYIEEISPFAIGQVIIKNQNNNQNSEIHNLSLLKGIDPDKEQYTSTLKDTIISTYKNKKNWLELLKHRQIFIGQTLAQSLGVSVGQVVDMLYPNQEIENNKVVLNIEKVKISAIFKTGINEFDEHVILTSLDFFEDIFQRGITGINIKLKNNIISEQKIIKLLKDRLKLDIFSWKDFYPALVSALTLEKTAMVTILFLITIIAVMNIISLLFMLIMQKRKEIALLKSNGMSNNSIMLIFTFISMSIAITTAFMGILLAWALSWLINNYKLIRIPDAYYINYLPAQMNWQTALIIATGVIITSLLVTIIPARKTKDIEIAQILKNEIV